MQNLKSKGYIEKASEPAYDGGREWYWPYFVRSQAEKSIVYDGKFEYKELCINDVNMTFNDIIMRL